MSKLNESLEGMLSELGRRSTILALALGLAISGSALLPALARAQDEDVPPPGFALDVCDVTPDDPACHMLTDEEFAAIVAEPVEPDWPGAPVGKPWLLAAPNSAMGLQSRHQLGVRRFNQNDSSWKNNVMRTCGQTIGKAGCAVTSSAMVMWYYGGNKNPAGLNECLGNYACDLYWPKLDGCSNGRSHYAGQRGFSYRDLRDLVNSGRPAIVKAKNSKGGTHFVVVVGYDDPPGGGSPDQPGLYVINDPLDGTERRLDRYSGYSAIPVINKVKGGTGL